ncbi:MAG: hypothetical protein H0V09_00765 [Gemmatimonadetes bacterium]|nr:hypothetical protein [Gemmatimonadota bacterium]
MVTLLLHVCFVFVVLGSKLLIALWVIYYLFPRSRECPRCDADTLSLRMGWVRRLAGGFLFLGRVGYRWCAECGWTGFVRHSSPLERPAGERSGRGGTEAGSLERSG